MTKIISELLHAKEPLFSLALKQLEAESGKQGMDVRLTAEIIGKTHLKIRELGLDPSNTTGPELYAALLNLIDKHDRHLAKKIGASNNWDPKELIPKIKEAAEEVNIARDCWVLKEEVAKDMLRDNPPPQIMSRLGYSDVNEMLNHENLYEIYGALRFAEGPEWLNEFDEKYLHLKPENFETRKIKIVIMPHDRWADICEEFIHKKRHNITHLKELGVILMLPVKLDKMPGLALWALSLLFHYTNEIRLYSAFFKLKQAEPNFGKIVVETLIADPGNHAVMAGQHIHWRVIQRYFGKLEKEKHPEFLNPTCSQKTFTGAELRMCFMKSMMSWHSGEILITLG